MKINSEISLSDFQTWSGATETKEAILNANKGDDFDNLIEELYPYGLTDTRLNDILWFEEDWIFETLGIKEDEDETDEDETDEDE